ncbi:MULTISPECIES: nickel-responsive transcriptional regulator NikR [unclassified Methylobacterium]|uniref:nickel-responsive transcriptional regulator NikR n=1 Tax=unclassified Methylobacterium TaxID=2615210 RepID=UPI0006FDD83D|nr:MULTISPECIES: nickel-responsive transcriptional regulator NikR [unclassified Methylobacterium]KQP94282.1 CopG family transcriptional regulator [Methylobacterium sp. Leaf113]
MSDNATAATGPEEAEGTRKRPVSRISLSLSEDLLCELDTMVGERGFASRSQAVATILHRSLVEHRHEVGDRVMVGTITLCYDNLAHGLQQRLAELQRRFIAEVISSLHVHLMHNQTLEVVLVQGPADTLQTIADAMITERGVISGRLELVAALIPPIHPFPGAPA